MEDDIGRTPYGFPHNTIDMAAFDRICSLLKDAGDQTTVDTPSRDIRFQHH